MNERLLVQPPVKTFVGGIALLAPGSSRGYPGVGQYLIDRALAGGIASNGLRQGHR
jgi:hypothetical protein